MTQYAKLCSDLEVASFEIAKAFIRKMYEIEEDEMDEIYFIGGVPTGTLEYSNEYWSLSDMYETLLIDYLIQDVWNWYYITTSHSDIDCSMSISAFVELHGGYSGGLATLASQIAEERRKNTEYWESTYGKAETEAITKPLFDKFKEDIAKYQK